MYGTKQTAILPATGLGMWSTTLAVIAVAMVVAGLIITARNARMKDRP